MWEIDSPLPIPLTHLTPHDLQLAVQTILIYYVVFTQIYFIKRYKTQLLSLPLLISQSSLQDEERIFQGDSVKFVYATYYIGFGLGLGWTLLTHSNYRDPSLLVAQKLCCKKGANHVIDEDVRAKRIHKIEEAIRMVDEFEKKISYEKFMYLLRKTALRLSFLFFLASTFCAWIEYNFELKAMLESDLVESSAVITYMEFERGLLSPVVVSLLMCLLLLASRPTAPKDRPSLDCPPPQGMK